MGRWLRKRPEIQELEAQQARLIREALDDTDATVPLRGGATAGGDRIRMRGLPVQAKGVGGTQLGTNPLSAILAKQSRKEQP